MLQRPQVDGVVAWGDPPANVLQVREQMAVLEGGQLPQGHVDELDVAPRGVLVVLLYHLQPVGELLHRGSGGR